MQRHDVASKLRRRCIDVMCLLGIDTFSLHMPYVTTEQIMQIKASTVNRIRVSVPSIRLFPVMYTPRNIITTIVLIRLNGTLHLNP